MCRCQGRNGRGQPTANVTSNVEGLSNCQTGPFGPIPVSTTQRNLRRDNRGATDKLLSTLNPLPKGGRLSHKYPVSSPRPNSSLALFFFGGCPVRALSDPPNSTCLPLCCIRQCFGESTPLCCLGIVPGTPACSLQGYTSRTAAVAVRGLTPPAASCRSERGSRCGSAAPTRRGCQRQRRVS